MFSVPSQARQENETPQAEEEFDASSFILEHIADSHEWHILTKKNGESVAIYLPVILYSKEKGLDIFSSRKLAHGHEYKGYKLEEEGELKGRIVNVNEDGSDKRGKITSGFFNDKNCYGITCCSPAWIMAFYCPVTFLQKNRDKSSERNSEFPRTIILFVRDDIALPNIGEHKYEKYMPYLLTVFLLHTMNNLYGTYPLSSSFRSKCYRKYCCYICSGSIHIFYYTVQR